MDKVKVINRATGVEFQFSKEKWDNLKDDPKWGKVFKEIKPPSVPIEVQNLDAENSVKVEVEPKEEAVIKAANKKTSKNNTGN